jgi:hypothetical protein
MTVTSWRSRDVIDLPLPDVIDLLKLPMRKPIPTPIPILQILDFEMDTDESDTEKLINGIH